MKTFGIGADLTKDQWTNIIRDLVDQGYIVKSEGLYPTLKLSSSSEAVLNGRETVMITKSKDRIELEENIHEYEIALLQQLKQVRKELALLENVPPYLILSDASLLELSTYLPKCDDLRKISGFGEVKIERYGKAFGDVVESYCVKHSLKSRMHLKSQQRNGRPERDSETKQQSYGLFMKGFSVQQIAEMRNLSIGTIETHLAFYLEKGKISITQLMDTARVNAIMKAIEKSPSYSMTPVKELLGESFSYGQIRLVKSHVEFLRSSGQSETAEATV
jgi:ATP-dependent DNA helicase RecQ